jgi:Dopa 4,5-dioxygenase family
MNLIVQRMALSYVEFVQQGIEPSANPLEDIYFHQKNKEEHQEALNLRDAVLRLRRDGAFVAVPLWRVNEGPMGPHPVGKKCNMPCQRLVF